MNMRIIADSGATKTDWLIYTKDKTSMVRTTGINPYHQTSDDIKQTINLQLLPELPKDISCTDISEIYFYGAGCTKVKKHAVEKALEFIFPASKIYVESDLLGAARALLGKTEGIACILGTGSNSCLYDGCDIVANTPPLGYILGDEGSGAVLGKKLVADCLKHQLPDYLCKKFFERFELTPEIILNKIYREPQANRFLSSLAPFIGENKHFPEIHSLLIDSFSDFFKRNLESYGRKDLSVNFVGSVAFYCAEELAETARKYDYSIGKIIQSPIMELAKYHS